MPPGKGWGEQKMTCREVGNLLGPFIDGELDSPQHETISLHVASCSACAAAAEREGELGRLVASTLKGELSRVDFSGFWDALEQRLALEERPASWLERVRRYVQETALVPRLALAGAFAAAVLLSAVFFADDHTDPRFVKPPVVVSSVGHAVRVNRVRARGGTLAVLREPRYDTTVLWVSAEGLGP